MLPCIRELIRLQEIQRVFHDKIVSKIAAVCNASEMPIFKKLNHYKTVLSLSLGGKQQLIYSLKIVYSSWASPHPYSVPGTCTKSHLLSTNPTQMQ